MSMERYCDECGKETMEYLDNMWASYPFSDGEELVDIYKCSECGNEMTIRTSERGG
jgi:DNA-directed RNA polymerase subunit RPC12/RpoP